MELTINSGKMQSYNGSIIFSKLDIGISISLKTSNGSIKGDFINAADDFKISSSAKNGSNNLPSTASGEKLLNANAKNGSIRVTFSKPE